MIRRLGLLASGLLALGGLAIANGTFNGSPPTETFDGSPPAPLAWNGAEWDVQVHSRDSSTWLNLDPINAQHGADCSAPPASHPNTSYEGSVYQCANHIMTAINAGGYGVIYLTPNQLVDFSAGSAFIKFDLSTLRMSTRDWVDIWITPYDDNLALPFDNGDVDLQGAPRTGIHITMSAYNGQTTFRCRRIDNFVESELNGTFWWSSVERALASKGRTPSATIRDTFEIELSATHLRMGMPAYDPTAFCNTSEWGGSIGAPLSFTKAVVQFGHHSYTPTKDNAGVPGTWHWDNISVSPSIPFSINHALDRYTTGGTVQFSTPAQPDANLRFSANGNNVEVNFGNGWVPARIQPAEKNVDRFKNYWMPIPAGTTSVQFRGNAIFNGPFFAKDMSIWSLTTSASTPIPTNTVAPSPTSTSTPTVPNTPTATSTTAPTSTPVPPTATATPTAPPTATPTPAPVCREAYYLNNVLTMGPVRACP